MDTDNSANIREKKFKSFLDMPVVAGSCLITKIGDEKSRDSLSLIRLRHHHSYRRSKQHFCTILSATNNDKETL
jgi:hypothetical protein